MKILLYNHTGLVSGAERVLLMILKRLDRDRFEPVVVCPSQGPLREMATNLGVTVQSAPDLEARFTWRAGRLLRYLRSFILVITDLRQTVKSTEPDLIHANSIRAGLVANAATLGLGATVVWHLHDLLPKHPLSTAIRLFAFLCSRTRMIAVSQAVAENFCHTIPGLRAKMKRRTTVVLNAVDVNRFLPDQNAREQIRTELGLNESNPVIGIVGQLTPRKGQLELIRAFAKVLDDSPKAVLLIAGAPLFNRDFEYEQVLKDTASSLGLSKRVRFLGARNDIGALMQTLDLLVVNSAAEPFGLVALEGMAAGTPVIAPAIDGFNEMIEHRVNGWLVKPNDESDLVAAMLELGRNGDLRAQFAAAGKKAVKARFLLDRYMTEIESFYGASCQRPRSLATSSLVVEPAPKHSKGEQVGQIV